MFCIFDPQKQGVHRVRLLVHFTDVLDRMSFMFNPDYDVLLNYFRDELFTKKYEKDGERQVRYLISRGWPFSIVQPSSTMSPQPTDLDFELASSTDVKGSDLSDTKEKNDNDILVNSVDRAQPIVTQRELWSYYCEFC